MVPLLRRMGWCSSTDSWLELNRLLLCFSSRGQFIKRYHQRKHRSRASSSRLIVVGLTWTSRAVFTPHHVQMKLKGWRNIHHMSDGMKSFITEILCFPTFEYVWFLIRWLMISARYEVRWMANIEERQHCNWDWSSSAEIIWDQLVQIKGSNCR